MKKLIIIGLFFTTLNGLNGQCRLDQAEWKLVYEENFNGTVADLSQDWVVCNGRKNGGCCGNEPHPKCQYACNNINNVEIKNGNAYFHTKRIVPPVMCEDIIVNYSTSNMNSKYNEYPACLNGSGTTSCNSYENASGWLFGMFEIRCKMPKNPGTYLAFWLLGKATPPEVDVFEYGSGNNHFFSTLYKNNGTNYTNPGRCSNFYHLPYNLTDDYHTFTLVWTPRKMTWFLDYKELKTDDLLVPDLTYQNGDPINGYEYCRWNKMDIILGSGPCYPDAANPSGVFDPFIVDYVKVYKPKNLPSYTGGDFHNFFHNQLLPAYETVSYKTSQDWNLTTINTNFFNYNFSSNLNVGQNGGKFIYKGNDGLLWGTYWANGNFYSIPLNWFQRIDGDVVIAKDGDISFCKYRNMLYYHQNNQFRTVNRKFNFLGWTFDFPVTNVKGNIAANPNGLEVVYQGTDFKLWHCSRQSLSSNTWTVTAILNMSNVIDLVTYDPSNYNVIYYKAPNNHIGRFEKVGNVWNHQSISNAYSGHVSNSLAVSPDGKKIYYKNIWNGLEYFYFDQTTNRWLLKSVLAIYPWSGGNLIPINNVAGDVNVGQNPEQIYFRGTDGRIWVVYTDINNKLNATSVDWTVNYAKSNLKLMSSNRNSGSLCFIGTDNKIRTIQWGNCEVLNPTCTPIASGGGECINPPCVGHTYLKTDSLNNISESYSEEKIEIYPNPVSDLLTVSIDENEEAEIQLIDLKGSVLKGFFTTKDIISVSMTDVPKGYYLIRIRTSSVIRTFKVIKI